jgi:bifunctional non-homologous end joining protein LigD
VNELAAPLWAVNLGSIELHSSLHRRDDLQRPTTLAFEPDPGEGVGMLECCEVGLRVRDMFAGVGLRSFAKTSGSKGLRVYVPGNADVSYSQTKPLAKAIAELVESAAPADGLAFEMHDVLERVADRGDLFDPVLTLQQELRAPGS